MKGTPRFKTAFSIEADSQPVAPITQDDYWADAAPLVHLPYRFVRHVGDVLVVEDGSLWAYFGVTKAIAEECKLSGEGWYRRYVVGEYTRREL